MKKPRKITPKSIPVSITWIKQVHKEVCSGWKQKLEMQFPKLFPNIYIQGNIIDCCGNIYLVIKTANVGSEVFAGVLIKKKNVNAPVGTVAEIWGKEAENDKIYKGPKLNINEILKIK